jgi:hypothetical protein
LRDILARVAEEYVHAPWPWRRIVDILAAPAAALDRGFVPAIQAASGPSPVGIVGSANKQD